MIENDFSAKRSGHERIGTLGQNVIRFKNCLKALDGNARLWW